MTKSFVAAVIFLFGAAAAANAQGGSPVAPTPTPSPSPGIAEAEPVVVSGGAIERSETDTAQPVTVLTEEDLKSRAEPTLGDTLRAQPGIAGSGFTAGASRPIIRGQ